MWFRLWRPLKSNAKFFLGVNYSTLLAGNVHPRHWCSGSGELNCLSCRAEPWDRCRDEKIGRGEVGCACSMAVLTGLWYFSKECGEPVCESENLLTLLLGLCRCVTLLPLYYCSLMRASENYLLARVFPRWVMDVRVDGFERLPGAVVATWQLKCGAGRDSVFSPKTTCSPISDFVSAVLRKKSVSLLGKQLICCLKHDVWDKSCESRSNIESKLKQRLEFLQRCGFSKTFNQCLSSACVRPVIYECGTSAW